MDRRIVSALRCPVSRGALDLQVIDSAVRDGIEQVLYRNSLLPGTSLHWFPIINYVPVLLTFRTGLVDRFRTVHGAAFGTLAGYAPPNLPPMPGEKSIQKTFTEEWSGLGNDDRTFLYSDSELVALHRDVWLRFSEAEMREVKACSTSVVDSERKRSCWGRSSQRRDLWR